MIKLEPKVITRNTIFIEAPIFAAVWFQNIEQVTNFLESGTSVQRRHVSGDFVIHSAARSGQV